MKHLEDFLKRNRELLADATPGPWVPDEISDPNLDFVLRWPDTGYIVAKARAPANTKLISASRTSLPLALEMLEACREQLEFIAGGCLVPPDGGSPRLEDAVKAAAEALAALEEKAGSI